MRYLDQPAKVHMDHVSAVLDVDFSPTGKEFVSASFDKTIRIFPKDEGHSRSVTLVRKQHHSHCLVGLSWQYYQFLYFYYIYFIP